jgi:hypothetical protein
MSSFTRPLDYDYTYLGVYKTRHPFTFYLDDPDGEYIHIPAGFESNGASIPRVFRVLFGWNPMDYRWAQASFVHDALVGETSDKLLVVKGSNLRYLTWQEAATWFDKALQVKMGQYGFSGFQRKLFVLAVRWYGLFK